MLSISAVSKQDKNKLSIPGCYLILLDIEPKNNTDDSNVIRLVRNNEDVVWKGKTYQAFPFTIDSVKEDSTGSEPEVELTVDNTTRALQGTLEDSNGGNGYMVTLRIVYSENLDGDPDVEELFTNNHTTVTQSEVKFKLGSGYPLNGRRPLDRFMKDHCRWVFKDIFCGYNGSETKCNHSLTNCRKLGNSSRFGAFPGIDQKGIYLHD
jgi:lambda family phage minor tail protein L